MASEFKLLQPRQFHQQFLSKDIRSDGRDFNSFRPTLLNSCCFATSEGSATIKLGNTSVVCGIKSEVVELQPEALNQGVLTLNVELPALCSSKFSSKQQGACNSEALAITELVAGVIKNSGVVDLEKLCILENKFVWNLNIEVICLAYDGNFLDACFAVVIAALKSCSLPTVNVDENTKITFSDSSVPVEVCCYPVATSFTMIDDKILVDPTFEEESLSNSSLTLVVDANNEKIYLIHKTGGNVLDESQFSKCFEFAKKRSEQVKNLINGSLKSINQI